MAKRMCDREFKPCERLLKLYYGKDDESKKIKRELDVVMDMLEDSEADSITSLGIFRSQVNVFRKSLSILVCDFLGGAGCETWLDSRSLLNFLNKPSDLTAYPARPISPVVYVTINEGSTKKSIAKVNIVTREFDYYKVDLKEKKEQYVE